MHFKIDKKTFRITCVILSSVSGIGRNDVHFMCGLTTLKKSLEPFCLASIVLGVLRVSSSTLSDPQAKPEAFLAQTYPVKSPVIKQLEGPH